MKRIKPCKNNNNIIDNNNINENDDNYINELDKLKIENEKLKKEIERLLNENKNNINIVNNINNENIVNNTNNGNIVNNTNNGNIVNNTNNQNITINNNINIIQIVNHGEENYDKINMNEIIEKLNNPPPLERVSSMIYYIHCNDEFPEYQNIYVSDLSRGKMKIYKNGEWRNIETKSTVDALSNKIIEYYDDSNEDHKKIFSFIKKEANKTYPCNLNYTDKNRKQGINNSINILYNNRDKIKAIKAKKEVKKVINLI